MTFGGAAWAPGSPAEALEKGIAMVHQHFSLVPRMTVVENLMLGQVSGMLKRPEFGARIRDIAESFGFTLDPDAVVGELSVGERQRAEIVKCLMRDPRLLVLDEPTAVLPPGEIGSLLDICRRVADSGRAVILVTHKLAEIARVADRVAVLRTGRLVADESMAGRRHGRAGARHGRPRAEAARRGAGRVRRGAGRWTVSRWAERRPCGLRSGLRRPHRRGSSRRTAPRQLHPGDPAGRDRRAGRRRRQRPERARHGAGRPAGADRGPLLHRRQRSHPCAAPRRSRRRAAASCRRTATPSPASPACRWRRTCS